MSNTSWYLPTNIENVEFFITRGIITCKADSAVSYMTDIRNDYPQGYIPFFGKDNLIDAIEKSIVEDELLIKCIIELDFTKIKSLDIHCRSLDGNYHVSNIADGIEGDYQELLLPSPLPLQCIKKIIFEKEEDKKEFSFLEYAEIKLSSSGPEKKLFSNKDIKKQDLISPDLEPRNNEPLLEDREVDYDKIYSMGGMLGLMFYQTKNGRESISYFNEVSQLRALESHEHEDFKIINNYFFDCLEEDAYINITCSLLALLSKLAGEDIGHVKYNVQQHLSASSIRENKWEKYLRKIENRVVGMAPEEIFDKLMPKYLDGKSEKIFMLLVMYFVRGKTQTMLKFYNANFNQIDYMLFTMFFGVASQYTGLPQEIKNIKGLSLFISNRMAEYAHKNEGIEAFKSVKPPTFVINGMIKGKSDGNNDKFINWFSKSLGLNSESFQHWECTVEEFSCDTNSQLTFKDEPLVTTDLNQEKIKKQIDDLEAETDEQLTSIKSRVLKVVSDLLSWSIQTTKFECNTTSRSKLILKYRQQPVVKTVVDLDELEKQIMKSTIGNDKELFDYNKVLEQYNKSVK